MTDRRNRFGLIERDMNTIRSIFSKYPEIKTVYLFGSRAKGNYKQGSDIDLAIMDEGIEERTLIGLRSDFEESTLPYNVDLVDFPGLQNQEFIDHIERVGIPFFRQEVQRI